MRIIDDCYSLRKAAGLYWLLDMKQVGNPYKRPMSLNEIGAQIWDLLEREYTLAAICREIAAEYNAEETEVQKDVLEFINQLKAYGVNIEE